jgi:outer membrane protein insertion porin family
MAAFVIMVVLALAVATDSTRAAEEDDVPLELKTLASVHLDGRHHVPAREIWAVLKTRRPSIWPWHERARLRLDFLKADTASVASVCRQHGYLDARVSWRIVNESHDRAEVRFVIDEGRQSHIRDVRLDGIASVSEKDLRKKIYARSGRAFNPSYLVADTLRISRFYQERGYLPRVATSITRDSVNVHVRYVVSEGPLLRFGETYLASPGELKVSPHLVRRELMIRKGEPFQVSRVERSIDHLYQTGLFSQAQITMLPDTATRTVGFELRVRERKKRWVDAGVGGGTSQRIGVTAESGHRNLTGHGQEGVLSTLYALDGAGKFLLWHNQASVLEPWLLRERTRGQLTVYYDQRDDRTAPQWVISQVARGVTFQLRRELDRYTTVALTQDNVYVTQAVTFLDPSIPQSTAESLKVSTPSAYTTHRLQPGFQIDSRDNPLIPLRGMTVNATAEVAGGPLKGSSSFRKLQGQITHYGLNKRGWVLAWRARAGVIDPYGSMKIFTPDTTVDSRVGLVPLEDRFRVGGVSSIRGYNENSIPTSGGLAMMEGSVEFRIPLLGPIGIEVYADGGNAWERPERIRLEQFRPFVSHEPLGKDDVRYVFGIGPRINLPIGPLRLDFTWSLRPTSTGAALVGIPQFAIGPSF